MGAAAPQHQPDKSEFADFSVGMTLAGRPYEFFV